MLPVNFRKLRWSAIPRRAEASARLVWLMLAARFLDEWWFGLISILLPAIQADLGLSIGQVSLLLALIGWSGWVVDPLVGLAGDVLPHRPLAGSGALLLTLSLLLFGGANGLLALAAAVIIYVFGSTPVALVADVTLVETHPQAEGRIMARQTLVDTFGALLAPATAALIAAAGVDWRIAFFVGAVVLLAYAALLWRTRFPRRLAAQEDDDSSAPGGLRAMWRNLRAVSTMPQVWRWLLFITLQDFLTDVLVSYLPLLLALYLGLDEGGVALVMMAHFGLGVVSLALLEPALARWGEDRVLRIAVVVVGLLFPLWLLMSAPLLSLLLLAVMQPFISVFWPLGRARLLAAAEGRTATVNALSPIAALPKDAVVLAIGALAEVGMAQFGLGEGEALRLGMFLLALAAPLMWLVLRGAAPLQRPVRAEAPAAD